MKKRLVSVFALLLMLLALAGCTGSNPSDPSGADDSDNPGDIDATGLPSWLANKTWKGDVVNNDVTLTGFTIRATDDDLYITRDDAAAGPQALLLTLEQNGINFKEYITANSYKISADDFHIVQNIGETTAIYEGEILVTIKKISDVKISFEEINDITMSVTGEATKQVKTTIQGNLLRQQ